MGKPPPTFKSAILREIAEIIGADSTLKLAKAVGGTRVYIPATVHAGHWLTQTIGIDAAQKLAAHFAFETFNDQTIL